MDLQFNEQFLRSKFIPTLKVFLTRMGQPASADAKGAYLAKLLIPQELNAEEKKRFNEEYFLGVQPDNRAFIDERQAKYRDLLLEGMAGYLRQQKLLRGADGLRRALIPSEDTTFESSTEMNRNLLNMCYRLVSGFEKHAIMEKKGEMSEAETEKLENGGFKLVEINGEERVIDEDELDNMEPGAKITPFIQPGMGLFAPAFGGAVPAGGALTAPAVPVTSAPSAGGAIITAAEAAVIVSVGADDFGAAFSESRLESAKAALEAAGLEIVRMGMEEDMVRGVVKDVNGQLLEVEINALAPDSDPRKIKMTFRDPVRDRRDNRAYRGRYFYLSQKDLPKKFLVNGQRQSAENVYQSLPQSAQFKGFELPPETVLPGEVFAPPAAAGPLAPEMPGVPKKEEAEVGGEGKPLSAPAGGAVPGLIPEGGPVREPSAAMLAAIARRPGRPVKKGRRGIIGSTGGRKSKPAAAGEVTQTEIAAPTQPVAPPAAPPLRVGGQQRMQQMSARRKSQKNDRKKMALLVGGAAGIVTATPATALILKFLGVGGTADKAAESVTYLLQCIGSACFC